MKKIIKARWAILSIWLIATILLITFQPDINAILRHRGQQVLAENSPSVIADTILNKMDATKGNESILVFYDKNKISASEMEQIEDGVKSIRDSSPELGIDKILDPFSMPEAKSSLVSKDGTTLLVSFKLDRGSREVDDIKKAIDSKLSNVQAEHYLTGEDFINDDYLRTSISGVEKSAVLTVIFIFVILIIMFRSVITPLISLLGVAFSYFCSMGIAAQLIDKANFPITTLTQVLLILILFGIGTDYNILLFNRFKEELSHGLSADDAIANTYRTAGKTIAFSILTVLIAFFSLIFSESPIYKSGIVVVIGAAILLLEIVTLTPFAMKVLGSKLFWPSRNATGHKDSKLWDKMSSASIKHPVVSALIIILVIGSTVLFHQQKLNFDTIGELGDSHPSSKAFYIIADHFGRGQAMPVNVVIDGGRALDNNEALSAIDELTERLKKISGVQQVSSVTQPEGNRIEDFYIGSQIKATTDGLTKTRDGVDQIVDGLKLAQDNLASADFSQAGKMVDGTAQLRNGVAAMADGLKQIQTGLADGTKNPQTIANGIAAIESNLSKTSAGVKLLAENYVKMQSGYSLMGDQYQGAAQALLGAKSALLQMQSMVTALGNSYSGSQTDANYQGLKQTINSLLGSLSGITPEGIKALNDNYNSTTAGFGTANKSLLKISGGLTQMADGLSALQSGLGKAASGIGTIVTNMSSVTSGLAQMESAQRQLVSGLSGFSTFSSKLSEVNNGLKQISDGLGQTNGFLSQLNTNKTFYIPQEALTNESFKKSLDMFMSADRTITKLTVVLNDDPYSMEALNTVKQINETVFNGLKGTALSGARFGASGPSATTSDINDGLSRDLNRMIVIVLIGVFLVLLLVIRQFWTPVFITASLMGAYYAAMFVINHVFVNLMGYAGISSFVPFFSFIVIVALGVDYSIFLMMRFKEYTDISPREAIAKASRHIGGVVMSAAIILGGTFATLMPSGIVLLSELAVAVIAGLLVLCFLLLPVFLPAMIALPGTMKNLLSKNKGVSQ